jgi:hypothetical protein
LEVFESLLVLLPLHSNARQHEVDHSIGRLALDQFFQVGLGLIKLSRFRQCN